MNETGTILIIDDEEPMRDGCSQILARSGYKPEAAENGAVGLRKIRELKPDLVLIDLKMPGISGMEVLEKLPEIDANIVPIVITGYATIESAIEAMKKGAFDFLPKPFSPDELRIITERALEKRRLIQETARLQEEKRRIEENFITMITHQLRSPLAAVQQYLVVILAGMTGDVNSKQTEMMEQARLKLDGLMELIDDWLGMARISENELVEGFKPFDLGVLLSDLAAFMRPVARQMQVWLRIEDCEGLSMTQGDREALEQVFMNVISNAIAYNRTDGEVMIRMREEEELIVTEISDTGLGISEKDLPHIFDQFYRAKTEETKQIKGTGLGLSIAKKIVDCHHGSIEVASVVGEGTTFTILLPKASG